MPSPAEPPSSQLVLGVEQFNQGQYYDCHDTLEAIWMEAATVDKPFYQGILQFSVALYHLGNHNWQGAAILLGESTHRLQAFEPDYAGVDVTSAVDCGLAWLQALQTAGAEQVDALAACLQGLNPAPQRHEFGEPTWLTVTLRSGELQLPRPQLYWVSQA